MSAFFFDEKNVGGFHDRVSITIGPGPVGSG